MSRRLFLVSSAGLPLGCALSPSDVDHRAETGGHAAQVRSPEIGQWWRYARRDGFTGQFIDTQIERVGAVGTTVSVERQREPRADPGGAGGTSWETDLLKPYREEDSSAATLPEEIQRPWGMIVVDPHWELVQAYKTPVPLWPTQLRSGWWRLIFTKYRTPLENSELPWQLTMHAHNWETIRVPAGEFTALRYTNTIVFTDTDFSHYNSVREETIWLVPEVGRWVARESGGTYYINDSMIDQPFNEGRSRWELLAWA